MMWSLHERALDYSDCAVSHAVFRRLPSSSNFLMSNATIETTISKCQCCGQEMHGTDYITQIRKDAERYRRLKSFALPQYNVRTKMGDSISLYREQNVTIDAGTWEAMDAVLDHPVIETPKMKTFHHKLGHEAGSTMTVGELREKLCEYPPEMPVFGTWEGVAGYVRPEHFVVEKMDKGDAREECLCLLIDVEGY